VVALRPPGVPTRKRVRRITLRLVASVEVRGTPVPAEPSV